MGPNIPKLLSPFLEFLTYFNFEETNLPDRLSISIKRVSFSTINNRLVAIKVVSFSGVFSVSETGGSKSDSESSLPESIII